MVGFNPLIIFLASFINKKSFWSITRLDVICGILSIVGIILWSITRVGDVAIFFSILADGLAGLPTIIKSYKNPETENYKVFLFGGISALITLLTINIWNLAHFGFPLYILLVNMLFVLLIKFKLGKIIASK
jgi:hypothetical protein